MVASKYNWEVLDRRVDDLLAQGMRPSDIAHSLDMRAQTIRDRLAYRRRPKRADASPRADHAPKINRSCLNCARPFQARSRFLRLCPSCRVG
ncbi:conserved hypothetical protein [Gluconacetobacter diazotrophicus PA1 5]|uniref:hypothetical protein n=1 Tax=Gluconacetobacter diazotrophicus TaxID=33996 RepID=UPI000173D94F|nr:hypothetical protein [Gluconacetobacter diazotrophicus]ACI52224.1 conserved hypothetical protein [Gluconacetobacter diazotrophicus PA1 5]